MISEAERPPLHSQLFFQRRRRLHRSGSQAPWPSSWPIVATNRAHRYRVRICSPRKAFEWNERGRPWRPASRSRASDPPGLPRRSREARRHVVSSPYSALFCRAEKRTSGHSVCTQLCTRRQLPLPVALVFAA